MVAPGRYLVTLRSGGESRTVGFVIGIDPRVAADGVTVKDLIAQEALSLDVLRLHKDALELLFRVEAEMDKHEGGQPFPCPIVDPDAPEDAKRGGHGTSEYYMIRDFLDAIEEGIRPPIDVIRSMDFTVPGIIAHESAMRGGEWMDVPVFDG